MFIFSINKVEKTFSSISILNMSNGRLNSFNLPCFIYLTINTIGEEKMKSVMVIVSRRKLIFSVLIFILVTAASSAMIISGILPGQNVLKGKTIVVDAGHGGIDGGANNSYILEKDINLDIALKLQKKLENEGANVIMTRTTDTALSKSTKIDRNRYLEDLNARVKIINNSSAKLFISIHANSCKESPSTRGAIAFYSNSHPHNRDIAYLFQNIFNTYGFEYNGHTYKSHHIPQIGRYYLLNNANIPGIIVESGFISNGTDLLLLSKSDYKDFLAESIYKGIVEYFSSIDKFPEKNEETVDIDEERTIDMAEEDFIQY